MIGRFGLGNKRPSSNEPRNSDSQLTHSSQRLPQQVPSQSTSNFFSLPNWRRRNPPSAQSTPSYPIDSGFDDLGLPARRSSYNILQRDKPLPSPFSETVPYHRSAPCLPFPDESSNGGLQAGPSTRPDQGPSGMSTIRRPTIDDSSLHPPHSTFVLARAALGIGLQYVMPGQLPLSPSSENNPVPFVSDLPRSDQLPSSEPTIRRTKSHQKLVPDSPNDVSDFREFRRQRGLSLGPIHLGSDGKGKERERGSEGGAVLPQPKTISRKSSFWRRRNDSLKVTTPDASKAVPPLPNALPDNDSIPRPSLPSLRPMSPFNIDAPATPSISAQLSTTNSPSAVRRRHSERAHSETRKVSPSSSAIDNLSTLPSPRRRKSSRPTTADPTYGNTSYHANSIPSLSPSTPLSVTAPYSTCRSTSLLQGKTNMRPRSQTNPPLLHRLSMNLFSSSPSLPPVPPLSPNPISASPAQSTTNSPRPSTSVEIPKPFPDGESPESYVHRLMDVVNKADVASVLANSGDEFYAQSLRIYISRFNFSEDPLDVAVRKLLMHIGLPRETQQIDRVIEAFASRYSHCNPDLFDQDNTYILAFSLIMLHTDAFNKSNKHKMTKANYVKNTSLPGVASDVLDCFYDNIVFAPFIFIEDPVDVTKERTMKTDREPTRRMSTFSPPSANNSASILLGKSPRIDPYYLIIRDALGPLKIDVCYPDPRHDPYYYRSPKEPYNGEDIHETFVNATPVEICMDNYFGSSPFFSIPGPMAPASPAGTTLELGSDIRTTNVVKYGLLNRKDDIVEGGKRAINRKWKEWGVILMSSQLFLYRDPAWILTLLTRLRTSNEFPPPRVTLSRPDEMFSVKDSIAVQDVSYRKRDSTFRFAMQDGHQILFQAGNDKEMYEWIAYINYASAFKTANVRVRSGGLSKKDIELTGIAAATSHLREIQYKNKTSPQTPVHMWLMNGSANGHGRRLSHMDATVNSDPRRRSGSTDLTEPMSLRSEGSSIQFKATFDQVKADLAGADGWMLNDVSTTPPRALSLDMSSIHSPSSISHNGPPSRKSSRTAAIKQRILDLNSKLSEARSQIDSDLRFIRNVAVLTPFQRTTRDRLQLAANTVAKKIMQMRLEVAKHTCHRDILSGDLIAAEVKWQETKEAALNAARGVLQSRALTIPEEAKTIGHHQSSHIAVADRIHQPGYDSFHSALDHTDSPIDTTPVTETSSSAGSLPFHQDGDDARSSMEHKDGQQAVQETAHERFYTAPEMPEEQAEEWNKTKAAKRVSLVRLPTDLKMSLLVKPLRSIDKESNSPVYLP